MQIINTSNINEARKQILKLKKETPSQQIIIKAQDDEFNRKILEIKEVDILLSSEIHNRKDKLKQRDSGLNEFLCKLAKENKISIGIDISKINSLSPKEKAIVLSRIIQNIKLCKRTNTKIILFPKTLSKQEILSFFKILKGSPMQAKLNIYN
ncbi:MAG: hypothetical protein AABW67_00240 [Nanoarchaeota archaeon]